MSDETIKVDLTQKGDSANKDQSNDVDLEK